MRFWHKLSNIGVHEELDLGLKKRIQLANRLSVAAFGTVALYMLMFAVQGNYAQVWADVVLLSLMALSFVLMAQHFYRLARVLMSLIATAAVFIGTDTVGANSGESAAFLYYITVSLASLLMFTGKEWKLLAFVWLVNFGTYMGTFFHPNLVFSPAEPLADQMARLVHYVDLGLSMLVNSFIVLLLARDSDKIEAELHKSLVVSNKQREDLEATQHVMLKAVDEIMEREESLRQNNEELQALNESLVDAQEELKQNNEELQALNETLLDAQLELEQNLVELKNAQNSLVQSEKMASLGQLVAGVAHEINTPIGVAVTAASTLDNATHRFVELAQTGQMKKSDLTQYISDASESSKIILRNLERAAELVKSFKQVAVNTTQDEKSTFHVLQTTNEILNSLKPTMRKTKVQVHTEIPADLMLSSAPGALSQILINFVTNSLRYAFDPGQEGTILIKADATPEGVELVFSDNGKGIPPENLSKIFDPFFTTGRSIGGTGLGLNIVYNLVTQKLSGKLQVDSTLGCGTTFILNLPNM